MHKKNPVNIKAEGINITQELFRKHLIRPYSKKKYDSKIGLKW